jgi:tape measure domain-containing protein
MAEAIGALRAELSANAAQFESDMKRAKNAVQSNATGMSKSMDRVKGSFDGTIKSLLNFKTISAAAFIAGTAAVMKIADEYTLLDNKLKLVTKSSEDLQYVEQKLYEQSLRSHSSYSSSVDLFSRFAKATETLGVSQDQLLQVTETLNKAMIISGATQEESKNAIIQLSQGMASGVLRGEEFNSIMENGSRVAKMLADYLKVDIGELRAMAKDGKITSDVMINAFTAATNTINAEFGKMQPTIAQAMTDLRTVFGKLVSDSNKGADGTKSVAEEITKLAKTIDENRQGIIELFVQIISLAGKAAKAIGNIGQSIQGWAAVKAGRLSFLDFARMNAEELAAWLKENNNEVKKLQGELDKVNRKIEELTDPITISLGYGSTEEVEKLVRERARLEDAIRKAQQVKPDRGSEFPEIKGKGAGAEAAKKAAEEAQKHAEQVKKVIEALKFEHEQLLRNDREKAVALALEQARETTATKWGQTIAELAGKNYDLAQETKAAADEAKAMTEAYGEWEKEKQAVIDAIDDEIERIKEEASTYGMSQKQITLYRLAQQGATKDQIELADAMLTAIERQEAIKKLTEELITPQETYNAKVKELKELLDNFSITWDQYTKGIEKAKKEMEDATKEQTDQMEELKRAIEGWGRDSADAIVEFCLTGKNSFKDMVDAIIKDILRMLVYRMMIKPLFDYIGSGIGILGFGSGKANGGVVQGGKMYPVNERGAPELLNIGSKQYLMMTKKGGYVSPLKDTGGTGGSLTINIPVNVEGSNRLAAQLRNEIEMTVQRVIRDQI